MVQVISNRFLGFLTCCENCNFVLSYSGDDVKDGEIVCPNCGTHTTVQEIIIMKEE